jgi:hypothetical protein
MSFRLGHDKEISRHCFGAVWAVCLQGTPGFPPPQLALGEAASADVSQPR